MPNQVHPHDDPMSSSDTTTRAISRRRLIKMLVASGLVAAGSTLPGEWLSPAVEMGVLPAHAQVSPSPNTIPDCFVGIVDSQREQVRPRDSIWFGCRIAPAEAGIQIRWTVVLNQPNLPEQQLGTGTGFTDDSGEFGLSDFDLGPFQLAPVVGSWLSVSWEIVGSADEGCDSLIYFETPS